MQRLSLGGVVLGCTLVGTALMAAQPPPPIPGATVSAGQQYFVRYCSACHGVAGHGDGPERGLELLIVHGAFGRHECVEGGVGGEHGGRPG